jgi:protease-4
MQTNLHYADLLTDLLQREPIAVDTDYWQGVVAELKLISGTGISAAEVDARRAKTAPRLLSSTGTVINTRGQVNLNDKTSTPAKSVAHLQLSGLMVSSDLLWFRGVHRLTAALMAADANPRIGGVLLEVDSGGGQVTAGQMLLSTLTGMKKPVVVLAHYLASAAVMATLPANAILASSPGARVGSIGTFITIDKLAIGTDQTRYRTIYAKKSTRKNHMTREAQRGNFKPIEKHVEQINERFLSEVRKFRPLKGDIPTTLSGEVFFAAEAQRRGLIDRIGTFNTALTILNGKASKGVGTKAVRKSIAVLTPPAPRAYHKSKINRLAKDVGL